MFDSVTAEEDYDSDMEYDDYFGCMPWNQPDNEFRAFGAKE